MKFLPLLFDKAIIAQMCWFPIFNYVIRFRYIVSAFFTAYNFVICIVIRISPVAKTSDV